MAQDKARTQRILPPYLPYRTFINFIDGLRPVGVPGRIDKTLMRTMSGATKTNLVKALAYLQLMDSEGRPSDLMHRLVHSEGSERQAALSEMLVRAYPFAFDAEAIDLQRATEGQLSEQFKAQGIDGDTVRKAMSFFLNAAKAAELVLSPHLKTARGPRSASTTRTRRRQSQADNGADDTPKSPQHGSSAGWQQSLLAKFPSFDPAWPDDVKSKWFEAFERLMSLEQESEGDA